MLHITRARHLQDFTLWLDFDDGTSGEVDLRGQLQGPIFQPLLDPAFFAQVALDPELETVVWPNGADLAPEFLSELQKGQLAQKVKK